MMSIWTASFGTWPRGQDVNSGNSRDELIGVIISLSIYISNHHAVYLKFTQCFMSIISQQNWEKYRKEGSWE